MVSDHEDDRAEGQFSCVYSADSSVGLQYDTD